MRKALLLASVAMAAGVVTSSPIQAALAPQSGAVAAPAPADTSVNNGVAADLFGARTESVPPILRFMQSQNGVKMTSMTPSTGAGSPPAYLLEAGDGSHQVGYLMPDGSMVLGVQVRISPDGTKLQNVTALQVLDLKQRFADQQRAVDEQKRIAEEAQRKADAAASALSAQQSRLAQVQQSIPTVPKAFIQGDGAPASAPAPAPAPVLPVPAPASTPAPSAPPGPSRAPDASPISSTGSAPSPTPALSLPGPQTPSASGTDSGAGRFDASRYASPLTKARLLQMVEPTPGVKKSGLPYFRIGAEGNPTLYMIADPQCPHCHEAWHHILPLIASGALTVKVILIDALPGSEPLAISLLARDNAAQAWLGSAPAYQGEGSTEGVAIAAPPPVGSDAYRTAQGWLDANMDFINKIDVTGTPWFLYVGKDGKVYQYSGDTGLDPYLAGLLG